MRKQAMFWLGQSNDPRALAFLEGRCSRSRRRRGHRPAALSTSLHTRRQVRALFRNLNPRCSRGAPVDGDVQRLGVVVEPLHPAAAVEVGPDAHVVGFSTTFTAWSM